MCLRNKHFQHIQNTQVFHADLPYSRYSQWSKYTTSAHLHETRNIIPHTETFARETIKILVLKKYTPLITCNRSLIFSQSLLHATQKYTNLEEKGKCNEILNHTKIFGTVTEK